MNPHLEQIKRQSYFLLGSVSLNILLLTLLFYTIFKERPPTPIYEGRISAVPKPLPTDAFLTESRPLIKTLKKKTINELFKSLKDKRIVENGYSVADFALSVLVEFYFFDIDRALQKKYAIKNLVYGDKGEALKIFPGLEEKDFLKIENFLHVEKWPFKTQGLYNLLKKEKFYEDHSLRDAFYLTPEFISVETLLHPFEKEKVLDILLSGSWETFASFYEKQKKELNRGDGEKRSFLLSYLKLGSVDALAWLLSKDYEFVLKKTDDKTVLQIMSLLQEKSPESERFVKDIIKSPRGETVRTAAKQRLFEYTGIQVTEEAALTFLQQPAPKVSHAPLKPIASKTEVKKAPVPIKNPGQSAPRQDRLYIVQPNDSLWKISKRFQVSIEDIRKINRLESDKLKPGTPLRL